MRRRAIRAAGVGALLAAITAQGSSAPPEDEVVLRVNGAPVMRSAVEKLLEPMRRAKMPAGQIARHRRSAVQNLVTDPTDRGLEGGTDFGPEPEHPGVEHIRVDDV